MTARFPLPGWQKLNAYVDGALSLEEASAVEAAAASDPAVQRALDDLRRTKAQTAALFSEAATTLPAMAVPPSAQPAARRQRAAWAVAATVILLVAGLSYWSFGGSREAAGWLGLAEGHYRAQLEAPHRGGAEAAALPAALAAQATAFDLSLAGLTLVETKVESGGFYLGYEGSRGCRLGLWVAKAPAGLDEALAESLRHGLLLATWRSGETGYALLSQDMDPRRFSSIARLLAWRTATEQEIAADAEALTLPCLG